MQIFFEHASQKIIIGVFEQKKNLQWKISPQ